MNKIIKEYKWIILILLLSLLLRIIYSIDHAIWWDSAVYLAMGKYIFSFGQAGFWEASRPLVWPIILGFFWKINLNPVLLGRILEMLFSLGTIYLTYLIGKEIFDKKTALFASLMLGLSPTFFFFNTILLTGIPSLFFSLLGIYLFLKKRYFISGIFLGLAFMTRFLLLGVAIMIGIYLLYLLKNRKISVKHVLSSLLGFSIIIIPYLIFNQIKYNDLLFPFFFQVFLTKNTGWIYHEAFNFYFINIIKENVLSIFALAGIIFVRLKSDYKKTLVLILFLIYLIYFSSIAHKETRFMITFLPYLYLLASYGIIESYKLMVRKKFIKILFTILILLWLVQESSNLFTFQPKAEFNVFQQYVSRSDVKEGIWITNPTFLVHSDKKADIIYFPFFNSSQAEYLAGNLNEAEHILVDTCDLLCPPQDEKCPEEKEKLLNNVKKDFKKQYYEKRNECEYFIFSS